MILLPGLASAQYIGTAPNRNGTIVGGEYGTHSDGANQNTNGGNITFITWDATNLYIAVSGPSAANAPMVFYLDKDPQVPVNSGTNSNGNLTGQSYDNTQHTVLPFRADLVMYVKSGYREYRTANGSGGWSGATTAFGSYGSASTVQEFNIAWSAIGGIPASFNFFCYNVLNGSSIQGLQPTAAAVTISTTLRNNRYYTVTSTTNGAATAPFSRDCFVFNSASSTTNFGAISVYDFTMNTASVSLTRTTGAGGAWTINGTMRINAGTVDFGSTTSGATAGAVTIGGGTLTMSTAIGGDLSVTGNWNFSSGTFNSTGSNNRRVTFNGSSAQTITQSGTGNFGYVTINNAAGVTMSSSATIANNLSLTNGLLTLGTNDLTVNGTALGKSISYVRTNSTGQLKMPVGGTAVTFPVGNSAYDSLSLSNSGTSDTYGVRVVDVAPPNVTDATKAVTRYWVLTEANTGGSILTAAPTYNSSEVGVNYNAGTTPYVGIYANSAWLQTGATLSGAGPVTATAGAALSPGSLPATSYVAVFKDQTLAVSGTKYTWVGGTSTDWGTASNWNPNTGFPGSVDTALVNIPGTFQLSLNGNRTVATFTLNGTGLLALGAGEVLTVNNDFTYGGSAFATFDPTSTLVIAGSASQNIPALNYGNLNIAGGNRVLASSGVISVEGLFTPGAGTITTTGSTVRYNTTAATTITIPIFTSLTANRSFHNLELFGGTSTVFNLPNGYNNGVTGSLYLSGVGTFNVVNSGSTSGSTLNIGGNLDMSGVGNINICAGGFPGIVNVTGATVISAGTLVGTNTSTSGLTNSLTTGSLTVSSVGKFILESSSNTSFTIVTVAGAVSVTSNQANAIDLGSGTANGSLVTNGNVLFIGGNFSQSGSGSIGLSGTYSPFAGYFFAGGGTQTLSYGGTAVTGGNIGVNSGSTLQLNSDLPFSSSGITGFAVIGRLNADNYSIIAGNSSSGFSTNGTGSTLSTAKTGGISGVVSGFTNASTAWPAGTTFEFVGVSSQTTGFSAYANIGPSTSYNITWLGTGDLTLDAPIQLTTLAYTNSGRIYLGNNNMAIASGGSITGGSFTTSKMIVTNGVGHLIRGFTTSGIGSSTVWPIGDTTGSADYAPVTISSLSATVAGTIGFRSVDSVHSQISPAVHYLSRFWKYYFTGGGTSSWGSATFEYSGGDVNGTQTFMKADAYNPSNGWTEFTNSSAGSNILTLTSGPGTATMFSGDDITGRLAPVINDYYRTVAAGPNAWTSASTWEVSTDPAFLSPAGTPASTYPTASNSIGISILTGHSVTFSSGSLSVDQLSVASTATLTVSGGTFNLAGTNPALTLNGTMTLGGASSWAGGGVVSIPAGGSLMATVAPSSAATVTIGGTYEHGADGGAIPAATWSSGSLCRVTGIVSTAPTGFNQAFYDLVWNCPGQTAVINLNSALATASSGSVSRDFTVTSTGSSELRLGHATSTSLVIGRDLTVGGTLIMHANTASFTAPASTLAIGRDLNVSGTFLQTGTNSTGTNTMTTTVARDVNVSGGTGLRFALSTTSNGVLTVAGNFNHGSSGTVRLGNGSGTATATFTGNFLMTAGGTFDFTAGSNNVTFNAYGDVSMPAGTTWQRSGGGTPTMNFLKAGTQNWNPGGNLTTNALGMKVGNNSVANTVVLQDSLRMLGGYIEVQGQATLNFNGTNTIQGTGTFTMFSQARVLIGSPGGITTSGSTGNVQSSGRNYNNDGFFTYNGTTNQVTGNGLPTNLNRALTISNTGGSGNDTVRLSATNQSPTLNLVNGKFAIGAGNTFGISNNGTVNGTGGDFAGGPKGGTLNFQGTGTFSGNLNPWLVSTSGQVDFGAGTVTFQNGGSYRLNSNGATLVNRGPYYASGSTLHYNSGSGYNRSNEWTATTGRGAPHHVLVSNNTQMSAGGNSGGLTATVLKCAGDLTGATSSLRMDNSGQVMTVPLQVGGNLSLASGGTLTLSTAAGGGLEVAGNFSNSSSTFNQSSRRILLNGTAAQQFTGISTLGRLKVENSSTGLTLTSRLTITDSLIVVLGKVNTGSDTLILGPTAVMTEAIANGSENFVRGNLRTVRAIGTSGSVFGGIGVEITPGSDLGTVFINRKSGTAVAGQGGCCSGNFSILRNWTITPSIQPALATRNVKLYWPSEDDNLLDMTAVKLWKSPDGIQPYAPYFLVQNASATNPREAYWYNIPSFSVFTVSDINSPLPLGLLKFEGRLDKSVGLLSWTMTNEQDLTGFVVEKSIDGKTFSQIGQVKSMENGRTTNQYRYVDPYLTQDAYYRLRLMKTDGQQEVSDLVVIRLSKSGSRNVALMPNPAQTGTQIAIDGMTDLAEEASVELIGLDGRRLHAWKGTLAEVNRQIATTVRNLPGGLYPMRMTLAGRTQTLKLVKR